MTTPQPGIFSDQYSDHMILEFNVRSDRSAEEWIRALSRARASLPAGCVAVLAFGAACWSKLAPTEVPDYLIPFHPIIGAADLLAPGTQSDVMLWIQSDRADLNFQAAMAAHGALKEIATLEMEIRGFRYLDSRDLTGFIDGTENPQDDDRAHVALIPDGQVGAGGSFVLGQKWVHDLAAFERLDVHQQQQVIGRTKPDSIELDDAPPTAHIRRTDVKIDGHPLQIYRRSVPFGNLREHGLYFLAFSSELMRFAIQLDRMFGCADDGLIDALTGYSHPVTGSYWFAPSRQTLCQLLD